MSQDTEPTPFGVTFIAVLLAALGLLEVIGGLLLLVQRGDADLLAAVDVTSAQLTTYALFSAMFGIIVVLVANALRTGSQWSRYVVAVIAAARLATLVWVVIGYHGIHWYTAIWPMVLYGLLAGYLFFDEDAKNYFS
jgi:hypothetical protein